MQNLLLVTVIMAAASLTGWFYWQTQKAEQRMTEAAAQISEKAALVGEMVDEVFAASQHLYHEMDRWQVLADERPALSASPASAGSISLADRADAPSLPPAQSQTQTDETPASSLSAPTQDGADAAMTAAADYTPHLHALKMALGGSEPVEIARQTGIGLEELRLLLRFQDAVNSTANVG